MKEENQLKVIKISYCVITYCCGRQMDWQFFDNLNDAIAERQNLIISIHPNDIRIEVSYALT